MCKSYVGKLTKSITKLLELGEHLKGSTRAIPIATAVREEKSKQEALVKTAQKAVTAKKPDGSAISGLNLEVEKSFVVADKLKKEAPEHVQGIVGKHCFTTASHLVATHLLKVAFRQCL